MRLVLATAPGERPMRPEFGCAVHDWCSPRSTTRPWAASSTRCGPAWTAGSRASRSPRWRSPSTPTAPPSCTSTCTTSCAAPTTRGPGLPLLRHPRPRRPAGRQPQIRKQPDMALPSPNLDDRRFQQFVDDAKRLRPAALPGVDRPQRLRPRRDPDRGRGLHGRPAGLPAEPGPGQELPGVPGPVGHQPVPAGPGARRGHLPAVRAAAEHRAGPGRLGDRHAAHRVRGGAGLRHRRAAADRAVRAECRRGAEQRRQPY